ncbi:MAG: protein-disulfide reductase DsbD domain-containing protein [Terriglobia bacterium]
MKRFPLLIVVLGASLALSLLSRAQLPKAESVVQVRLEPAQVKIQPGGTAAFTLVATVREGFHINSHQPSLDYLIPTRVELRESPGFVLEKVDYPAGELKAFSFAPDVKLSVYDGTVKLPLRLRAQSGVPAGTHTLRLAFYFQACNDRLCLRPAHREVRLSVRVQ